MSAVLAPPRRDGRRLSTRSLRMRSSYANIRPLRVRPPSTAVSAELGDGFTRRAPDLVLASELADRPRKPYLIEGLFGPTLTIAASADLDRQA